MIPLWWFSIIKTTHCGDPGGCIDLRQFGLVPMTLPDEHARVCGSTLVTICVENPWDMYLLGTLGAIACLVLVGHFLMIFSSNYAHIHDNFHRARLQRGRNAASYNPTASPNQYTPDVITLEEQENQYATSGRSRSRDPIGYSSSNNKDPLSYQM
ncbi:neuronal membrane glycoprotein M6-b-like [Saccoglossus kowalevskii]|uniref:Neuronal membrane glycoprotein M6-b-like n=1 Tax=Saccoglossus kowalevskii TaxID=10224 RepID=A0ABM0N0Y4_SACKO|nr:PREDICTED: neuronal membrane glycoprotein M6-b-like [Saccoglossus kowalevskii]